MSFASAGNYLPCATASSGLSYTAAENPLLFDWPSKAKRGRALLLPMERGAWGQGSCSQQRRAWRGVRESTRGSLRTRFSTADPWHRAEGATAIPALGGSASSIGCPRPTALQLGNWESLAPGSSLRIYFPYHKHHVLRRTSVARYSEVTSVRCAAAGKISTVIEI